MATPFPWYGNVTIGTNTSTNGALVGAYIGNSATPAAGTPRAVGSAGLPASMYQVDIDCTYGSDTVFLKVWGINATASVCGQGPVAGNSTNLSVSLVSASGACTYSSACASNNKCCSGTTEVNDGTTSGATCASSCSSSSSTSSSTGGGSGGGGGGGGGSTLGSETSGAFTAKGSGTVDVSFKKSADLAVREIEVSTSSSSSIANGRLTVRETTVDESVSSGVAAGSVKVYKYLSITKQNIKDSDVAKAKVTFEVPLSWFTTNNIDAQTVKLNRYVGSQWTALATKLVETTVSGYVYEAETPGFSIFAVSGELLPEKMSSFQIIDIIEAFYAGTSAYTAFQIIDLIEKFYA